MSALETTRKYHMRFRMSKAFRMIILGVLTTNLLILATEGFCQAQGKRDVEGARQASQRFAEELVEKVRDYSKKHGVAIEKISIDVSSAQPEAELQKGLIEVPIIEHLKRNNFYSTESDELAKISYSFRPSETKRPAEISVELEYFLNRQSEVKRNIKIPKAQEFVSDISGAQLSINSFGTKGPTDSINSPFSGDRDAAIVTKLTSPTLSRDKRAEIVDGFYYTVDPRNNERDDKFGFRLIADEGSPEIIQEIIDGVPHCKIKSETQFFIQIKNNQDLQFAFDAFIDGYPHLLPPLQGQAVIPRYLMVQTKGIQQVGWILIDPKNPKLFQNRSLSVLEVFMPPNDPNNLPEARAKSFDASMLGSITVRVYKVVQRGNAKGDLRITIGKVLGEKIDALDESEFEAVDHPLKPISQIVIRYEKR